MGVIFMIEIHKSTDDRQNKEAIGKKMSKKRVLNGMNRTDVAKKNQYLSGVSHTVRVSACA